jgi:DNA-binding NtrC family response regulator
MQPPGSILIIDDEPRLRQLYAQYLQLEGYEVVEAATAREGLQRMQELEFDLVLTDMRLPDMRGMEVLKHTRKQFPETEVIVVTAFGNIQDGVEAMREGAFDYLVKGDSDDQLVVRVASAVNKSRLMRDVRQLKAARPRGLAFSDLVGEGPAFRQAVNLATKVAASDAPVLILGETGVGKELFARAIHGESPRRDAAFVALNCAAIPREMLESELFGYKKGAFTGAASDKQGYMEAANGGTLFLDEIGEMPVDMQAKLLRALDQQAFNRLGDTRLVRVNVRIIAATHQPLRKLAEEGRFRQDLYFRLAVFTLTLPSLRERPEDVLPLSRRFLVDYAHHTGKKNLSLSLEAERALVSYTWPGNIRELRNAMERAVILASSGEIITPEFLPPEVLEGNPAKTSGHPDYDLEAVELAHIRKVLTLTRGNRAEAADLLGIGIATLYRKIARYHLE